VAVPIINDRSDEPGIKLLPLYQAKRHVCH